MAPLKFLNVLRECSQHEQPGKVDSVSPSGARACLFTSQYVKHGLSLQGPK